MNSTPEEPAPEPLNISIRFNFGSTGPNYPEHWNTYWYDSIVTMVFTPPMFGSADLILIGTPRGLLTHVSLSYCFDPLEDLVRWMREVVQARLPAVMKIDQEGSWAVLQALPVAGRPEWIELIIDFEPYPRNARHEKRLYWTRVECRQLVREFLRRFQEWRSVDYDEKEWHRFGFEADHEDTLRFPDPRTLDLHELEIFAASPSKP